MTPVSLSWKIAVAAGLIVFATVPAAAAPEDPPAPPPSAVSSTSLPSCPAGDWRFGSFDGDHPFGGSLTGAMYGQVFFANGGAAPVQSIPSGPSAQATPPAVPPAEASEPTAPPAVPAAIPAVTVDGGAAGPAPPIDPGAPSDPGGEGGMIVEEAPVDPAPAVTPEPGTLLLIGAGLGAMAIRRRRRQERNG